MGKITKHTDLDNDLTVYTLIGKVTVDDMGKAIQSFYDGPITIKVLCDLSQSDLSFVHSSDIEYIAHFTKTFAANRLKGKTAVFAPDDFSFGLSRMYELNKEIVNLPFETRSFRSLEAAYEWLDTEDPD